MKKTFERFIKLWVAGALLLLLIFAFPVMESKAAVAEGDVAVDYANELIAVKKNSSESLYFAVVKQGAEAKTYTPVFSAASGNYTFSDGTKAAYFIDLSGVNFKNPMTVYLKYQPDDEPFTVTLGTGRTLKVAYIGKTNETNKTAVEAFYSGLANFSAETGYFIFNVNGTPYEDASDVEWRTGRGNAYKVLNTLDPALYQTAGATLYFRVNNGDEPITKEAKVKIKKLAKAPAIKIDGNKMTLSVKSTMEYRVTVGNTTSAWHAGTPNSAVTAIKDLQGLDGDGYYKAFGKAVVEVRTAATEKARASLSSFVTLDTVNAPETGASVITVNHVNVAKPEKGLKVSNLSQDSYQVAVVKKGAWDTESSSELIKKISGTAKKTDEGYVEWVTVKPGKSATIAYKKYSEYPEYQIIYRRTPVAENKKTEEIEFRVASVVRVVGGATPVADTASGGILVNKGETVNKTVKFTVEPGLELYTSLNNGAFSKNTAKTVTFSAGEGDTVTIKAYTLNPENNDKSDTITYIYRILAGGELDCYKGKWGYGVCKQEDAEAGSNSKTLMYQRVYLAYSTYETNVDYGDLGLDRNALIEVIQSVRVDNPELIQADGRFSYTSSKVTLSLRDEALCNRLLSQCNDNVEEIKGLIKTKYGSAPTKVQQAKVIHDYLVLKKEYKDSDLAQTMAGSLSDEYTPVCMSYSLAFKYVCNALGIQCEIIFGDVVKDKGSREAHAWNLVNYGDPVDYSNPNADYHANTWYEMDITWDDPLGTAEDYIRYDYFNITSAKFAGTRIRTFGVYPKYPLEETTATTLSYANCISNHLLDELN